MVFCLFVIRKCGLQPFLYCIYRVHIFMIKKNEQLFWYFYQCFVRKRYSGVLSREILLLRIDLNMHCLLLTPPHYSFFLGPHGRLQLCWYFYPCCASTLLTSCTNWSGYATGKQGFCCFWQIMNTMCFSGLH